jgi:hypothetical protein
MVIVMRYSALVEDRVAQDEKGIDIMIMRGRWGTSVRETNPKATEQILASVDDWTKSEFNA